MTRIRLGILGLVVALTVQFGLNSGVHAAPIQATYSTTGSIGTTGIDGTPNVSFQGVSNGSLTTGQLFDVGQFIVTSQPGGATTTYDTPFSIKFNVTSASGDPALPNATPITLDGLLTTSFVRGHATLEAMFQAPGPVFDGPYPQLVASLTTGSVHYGLYLTPILVTLDPTSQNGGLFDLQGALEVLYTAPEPTPLVMLAAVGIVLALRRGLHAANRSRSQHLVG